jgi:MFS family permease
VIDESDFTGERRRAAFLGLGALMLVNVMSQLDRQIMSVLVEPIRKAIGFADTEMGIVVGLAFAVFYTLAGLPLGRLADVTNRKRIVLSVLSLWSLATAACGLARGFWTLFAARVFVGIGEAGASPAAQSILAESFPPARIGRALSTYQMAIPIGSSSASPGAGGSRTCSTGARSS